MAASRPRISYAKQHREERAGDRVERGRERRFAAVTLRMSGDAIDRGRGPVKQRRLVHRDVAVLDREQQLAVLDHLLDEHAFDRFVAGAYVAGAEPMKRQDGDDNAMASDRGGRWNLSGIRTVSVPRNTQSE